MAKIPDAKVGRQAPLTSVLYLPEAVVEQVRELGNPQEVQKPNRERNSSTERNTPATAGQDSVLKALLILPGIITKSYEILSQDGFIA